VTSTACSMSDAPRDAATTTIPKMASSDGRTDPDDLSLHPLVFND